MAVIYRVSLIDCTGKRDFLIQQGCYSNCR